MRLARRLGLPVIRNGALTPLLSDYPAQDDAAIQVIYLPKRRRVPRMRAFVNRFAGVFHDPAWHAG